MIRSLVLIIFLYTTNFLYSQKDIQYSQYMFVKSFYNPANTSDSKNTVSIALLNKNQWSAIDKTFSGQALSIHTNVSQERIGVGLLLQTENYNLIRQQKIQLPINYKINLKEGSLAFGIEPTISVYSSSSNEINAKEKEDKVLENNFYVNPNVSLGLMYQHENYYIGVSCKYLLYSTFKNHITDFNQPMIYIAGAYEIYKTDKISIIPSFLVRNQTRKTYTDIGIHTKIIDKLLIGSQFRSNKQFNIQSAVVLNTIIKRINNYCLIGYSFDYGYSNLYPYAGYTHEILLKYNLKKRPNPGQILKQRRTISPLFF